MPRLTCGGFPYRRRPVRNASFVLCIFESCMVILLSLKFCKYIIFLVYSYMLKMFHKLLLSGCILIVNLLCPASAVSFMNWSPPGPNDVRSPCPGLNSLANHGILPHSGKGLTIPILIKALKEGLNVGIDFSTAIGSAGLLSVPNTPLATSFDLNNLDEHNFPIEHDASLSRSDYYLDNGDNFSFNQTVFDEILAFYKGMTATSIPVAAKAKYARVKEETGRDAHFTYTPQQFVLSYGETALYLSTMGDPITGVAPLKYVKVFFGESR
jgi:hypothetical protein